MSLAFYSSAKIAKKCRSSSPSSKFFFRQLLRNHVWAQLIRRQKPDAVIGSEYHHSSSLQTKQTVTGILLLSNEQRAVTPLEECDIMLLDDAIICRFYSARNARIASAVLATAIPSVRLSVRPSVCPSHAGIVSKRRHVARCSLHCRMAKCVQFCRNQKIFPRNDPFALKSWLELTYPLVIAATLDTCCIVAPQP